MITSNDIRFVMATFLMSGASLGLSLGIIVMMVLIGNDTVTLLSLVALLLGGPCFS